MIPKKPAKGSAGELIWDKLNLILYPWENFSVERFGEFRVWKIRIYSVIRWNRIGRDMEITDEMIAASHNIDPVLLAIVADFRNHIAKVILAGKVKP